MEKPQELLEKLAALIPRPYANLIVYHGALAPNAKWRGEVVGFGCSKPLEKRPPSASTKVAGPCNRTWAELMRRSLEIDVLECFDETRWPLVIIPSPGDRDPESIDQDSFYLEFEAHGRRRDGRPLVDTPPCPMKTFANPAEAEAWLLSLDSKLYSSVKAG